MISTFATNPSNNDFILAPDGNIAILQGNLAILSIMSSLVQTQLGELPYATNVGVPTMDTIFNGSPNFALYEAALSQAALSVAGVTEIISLTLNTVPPNQLIYELKFNSIYGVGTLTNA